MSLPDTFKAAFLDGASNSLKVRDRTPDTVILAPQEVAIKISATAINPADWKLRGFPSFSFGDRLPVVLGSDAAGTIYAKGSDVPTDKFQLGDRVFFQGLYGDCDSASFQEFARADCRVVGKTPSNISDEEAAGVSLAGITAAIGLYHSTGRGLSAPWDHGGLGAQAGKGMALVVLGGSGSVGQYVLQLARLSGYERIVANASAAHKLLLGKLGASVALDRQTQNSVEDFITAIGAGVALDCVYDTIGTPETQTLAVAILQTAQRASNDASVVCTNPPVEKAVQMGKQEGKRQVEIKGIWANGTAAEMRNVSEPFYAHTAEWLKTGDLVPNQPLVIQGGLEAIDKALQTQQAGVSGVKVIVKL
ncbi:chaperonin 10-like protein [Microdochium trichocladiopsis]|uniref:Chaperonin 10-like protein n=1 Tax=Microdochium trichocladiopsis TaxID=1682393 RepID=A0A9P8Y7T2_9PEZI|nr:chaperonin 10-like protein [Microdochium trichocladiopsis]KAH7030576.1 chaperonin 10-like protein [Microdochium trichocladiopsis]